ncbi:hypothetical protein BSPLISOX_1324 [uncultured Gammaproteobacteria bacterium]|nr:hypothetical protein [uncultured Gammaproteobacteria bacterium]VVH67127.1 hypothetical protein BSPLISOX_1324 [uncultured Gammaproteobacteria bacterium]
MKKKHSIYFLPLYIAIGLITKIFVLGSYIPIPMINTESNIEKFVILLEDSIKNQDLKKSRKIIQFLKEDYQRQDKAISQIASYINEQSEKVRHEYINSIIYLVLLCIYTYIIFRIIRKL